jgi:polyhydroxyalkanoate synthase
VTTTGTMSGHRRAAAGRAVPGPERRGHLAPRIPDDPLTALDPAGLFPALGRVTAALSRDPRAVVELWQRWAEEQTSAVAAAVLRASGGQSAGPVPPDPADRRFADAAWERNPAWFLLRQSYLLACRLGESLVEAADVDEPTRRKARFLLGGLLDAAAPTNLLATNPGALKAAFDSGGASVVQGWRNFLRDLAENHGQPRQVIPGSMAVGRDLAVTPGKVVFRNDLVEVLQYAPQTDTVHEVPLLISPPWINKFYLMDLARGRSLVEWAVRQGHTVFALSYRNPDATMAGVTLDDYLLQGPRAALDVIRDITGSSEVDLVGLCLGGTLTAALLAWLDAVGEGARVRTATLINTLVDFSEPGDLGVFTDERTVARLERQMRREGFLKGESMRGTFDAMRARDLLWSYAVQGWLFGEDPQTFDILAWNADSTRMPAGMHSFYLRSCYLDNALASGRMELAGQRLDLGRIRQDVYCVAAEQDHIALWRSVYCGARFLGGEVRFVLSNAGHVAAVVNPPHPKARHRASGSTLLPDDPDAWLAAATERGETWWEDWARWLAERAGPRREPPPLESAAYPVLGDAPGTYVFG